MVVTKEAIKRFHPNNIDNRDFWFESRLRFPLLSVCGQESSNIIEANRNTLTLPQNNGFLDRIKQDIRLSDDKLNFLEIGFGYGNIFHEIGGECNYFGIDYIVPRGLKKNKNLIEITESGIPSQFLGKNIFDIVYSVNVFQHCSQEDRFKYITQSYDALKPGGILMFTQFVMTEENKNELYWGIVDEHGRGYTHFFNQLTECDREEEILRHIESVGFKVVGLNNWNHFYSFILEK